MEIIKLNNSIEVCLIDNIDDIESVRHFWEECQWHHYSNIDYYVHEFNTNERFLKPCIFVFYQDGIPIALIAGRIRKRIFHWKIGFFHFGHSEFACLEIGYHGVMGDYSSIDKKCFGKVISQTLKKERLPLIYLDRIPLQTDIFRLFRYAPPLLCRDLSIASHNNHFFMLPDSFQSFYDSKSKGTKKNIKSYRNRIKSKFDDQVKFICYRDKKKVEQALSDIKSISEKTYQHKIGTHITYGEEIFKKWAYLAEHDILRAYVLYLNNRPCAYWVFYHYNQIHYSMYTGYDPEYSRYRLGIVVLLNVIELGCEDTDCKSIDYGLGDEKYKQIYGTSVQQVMNFMIFNTTIKAFWYKILRLSTVGFAQFMSGFLRRMDIYHYVKMKWRRKIHK